MATNYAPTAGVQSTTQTLATTTVDTVTLTGVNSRVAIIVNHDAAQTLWYTWSFDSATAPGTPAANADGSFPVLPLGAEPIPFPPSAFGYVKVALVGSGNKYTVMVRGGIV